MPIRSQPYDYPSAQPPAPQDPSREEAPRPQDLVDRDVPLAAQQNEMVTPEPSGSAYVPSSHSQNGRGNQIHQRKDEWLKTMRAMGVNTMGNDDRNEREQLRSNKWLVFMIIAILLALVLFMMIPIIENFVQGEEINNSLENVKQAISFIAPVLILVAALAGTAGYFVFRRFAYALLAGHVLSYVVFALTIQSSSQQFNLGVYWIIIGSLVGGAIGAILEFFYLHKFKLHHHIQPLFLIVLLAFGISGAYLVHFTMSQSIDYKTYEDVSTSVQYTLYKPSYLPEKFVDFEPKIYVTNSQVSVYYGNDHYPPPPVIDFLSGIEFIQSAASSMTGNSFEPEPGVVFIDIGDNRARFYERRGRATIEWEQDGTHIVLNIYSNIPPKEMFQMARSLTLVTDPTK